MKIKVTDMNYDDVLNIKRPAKKKPVKQSALARWILKTASAGEVKATDFTYEMIGMDKLGKDEPALYLMNHSSFTDLCIAAKMLGDRQYHIITTNDGFIGKEGLMRWIGCIPTKKFVVDMGLVRDMKYTFETLNSSILMFPEASYSFDGTQTPLPKSLGKFIKIMNIPVVIIFTEGSFLRDPLYNNLQKRKAKVSSTVTYRLSKEDIKTMSVDEINQVLADDFTYDHFRSQKNNNIIINEGFRADGLHRALYKCPNCMSEGKMFGKGIEIKCQKCGERVVLEENGTLAKDDNKYRFEYVSDWYKWERECVAGEIAEGTYNMELDVDIMMLADTKSMYKVGDGKLIHNCNGFSLSGCDGKLEYSQSAKSSYGLYADYFWYEIGDVICIGDTDYQYYCFPKNQEEAIVAKARLATEELYRMKSNG